ncbi:DUF2478 domain-containing protein [Aquabacter sp. L1I39]|uniref:DUF2478 domain-containing protein n=1 Tax=Aquabacter sp. L1I39 TaxID=2820278 RepID=UPI001ADB5CB1|nr:DUF2478 domain-containing protein [Aquabacter sp. L1I39]QTL05482.1 DUF2478 domain-containing protein [Aquabacter sp. L1I39]
MTSQARILALQGADRGGVRRVLADAVQRFRARGLLVLGAVETLPNPDDPDDVHLLDLASGGQYPLNQKLGPGAAGCSLDPEGLAAACAAVQASIARLDGGEERALVILSKFGRQEAEGRGLTDAFHAAVLADLPILTSVSPAVAAAWADFAGPMARFGGMSPDEIDAWFDGI